MNGNYFKHSEVKANRVKLHKYFETTLDLAEKAKVEINMEDYD